MIAFICLLMISALLYSRSKYCTTKSFYFFKSASKKITPMPLNAIYLVVLFALYSIQMGWVMALFLMLFTLSVCLPIAVLLAHHHTVLWMFMVLAFASLWGMF